jgi:hypothetical protein
MKQYFVKIYIKSNIYEEYVANNGLLRWLLRPWRIKGAALRNLEM